MEICLKEIEELGPKGKLFGGNIINNHISTYFGLKRRIIFWNFSYWSNNLIRHILEVMHIEKNFFENLFNIVLEVVGKTKIIPNQENT